MMAQSIGSRQPDVADWRLFHRNNDEYWARMVTATTGWWDPALNRSKVRLSASDVRHLRLLAGIGDDEPSDPIVALIGRQMKLGQYLLVTAKPGGCLNVAVYGEGLRHFKQLWSSDALPNGSYICQPPGCPQPQVSVDEKHKINILTFSRSTPANPICDQFSSTVYEPKGKSFELTDQHTATSCWLGYNAGLNAAFRQAAGPGETLAIVQWRPALTADQYALVLQRRPTGTSVLRMQLQQKEDWSSAVYTSMKNATALDCFSRAASVHVNVTTLEIPQNGAQDLAMALDRVDLRTDRCARCADGACARLLDGRTFYVQVGDHAPIKITDVKSLRGYVSENPQLSGWIYKLLDETKHAKEIAAK
jgi:hypothetical protein